MKMVLNTMKIPAFPSPGLCFLEVPVPYSYHPLLFLHDPGASSDITQPSKVLLRDSSGKNLFLVY